MIRRIVTALGLLLAGFALGAIVGGAAVQTVANDEADARAHTARCLFRVAERHLGHERLIAEWRAEIRATQPPSETVLIEGSR